ncbi:MAG: amino acid ABC transporter permease [Alphaproteobacteria bacterium]|jgi:polar amino acid transport system permease protein
MIESLEPILDNLPFLWAGIETTLVVSVLSVACSLVLGFAAGLGRCYGPAWLRLPLVFYIDSMRAIPVLVVIVWTFFAFPILFGVTMTPIVAAVGAISVHVAASIAEIVRAGIESIRQGQSWAGLALGMSRAQLLRKVILPQAVTRMLPSFGSAVIVTIKDSAIASVIAVPDVIRHAESVVAQTYRPFEVYSFAMIVFFAILFPVARVVDKLYLRVGHRGRS